MVGVTTAGCLGRRLRGVRPSSHTGQLWLMYPGYEALGGCGLGMGYVSPVSALVRRFHDRRGMATGMTIMGFGGGGIIAAPVK